MTLDQKVRRMQRKDFNGSKTNSSFKMIISAHSQNLQQRVKGSYTQGASAMGN